MKKIKISTKGFDKPLKVSLGKKWAHLKAESDKLLEEYTISINKEEAKLLIVILKEWVND